MKLQTCQYSLVLLSQARVVCGALVLTKSVYLMHTTEVSVRSTGEPLDFLFSTHLCNVKSPRRKLSRPILSAAGGVSHEHLQTAAEENHDHHVCFPTFETNLKIRTFKEIWRGLFTCQISPSEGKKNVQPQIKIMW